VCVLESHGIEIGHVEVFSHHDPMEQRAMWKDLQPEMS